MSFIRARILGCGGCLPERVLTNAALSATLETSDAWIRKRTGIRRRHIASSKETSSFLGVEAARAALRNAGVLAKEVDLLVCATSTPDHIMPATAVRMQHLLGTGGVAFDVQAACSGFVFGLATANNFLRIGQADMALVIGTDTYSRMVDWEDRSTCVLFGDGAGAMVLQRRENSSEGILSTYIRSDGRHYDFLYASRRIPSGKQVPGGEPTSHFLGCVEMEGREVYRHAVACMEEATTKALEQESLHASEIDWLVPHQANARIIETLRRKFGIEARKTISTVDRHANTSAASIPLALAETSRQGLFKEGDLILLTAMGAGFTWGSALLRWSCPKGVA